MSPRMWNVFVFALMALVTFICTLIVIRWTVDFVTWSALDSGWAQTAGVLIGLGIAVWLPYKQKKEAAKAEVDRRADEQRRVCMAFRDELSLLKRTFTGRNVVEILRDAPGEIFDQEIPTPRMRFPIFNAMADRLVDVGDSNIRHGIIEAYEAANGLIDVGTMNNRRLFARDDLARQQRHLFLPVHQEEMQCQFDALVVLRPQMRTIARITIERVEKVLVLLDRAVA